MSDFMRFLEGDTGLGKSSLLGTAMIPYWKQAGGFTTQRKYHREQGMRFVLVPLHATAHPMVQRKDGTVAAFLTSHAGVAQFIPQPFEAAAAWLQTDLAQGIRLFLLDEVGGLEMTCPDFVRALFAVLDSDAICVGIFKSQKNSESLLSRVSLSEEQMALYQQNRSHLQRRIQERGQFLSVTANNRSQVRQEIDAFLHQNSGAPLSF